MKRSLWVGLSLSLLVAMTVALAEMARQRYYLEANPPTAFSRLQKVERGLAADMHRWESALYDARFRWRGPRKPDPRVVIVAISDQDLHDIGQWPWSRSLHARLIRTLEAASPRALLFDIFFIDPFTSDPRGDRDLVAATHDNPWVVHSMFFRLGPDDTIQSLDRPMEPLLNAAHALGYANAVIDEDGVLRRAIPDLRIEGQSLPLLSVAGANLVQGHAWDTPAQAPRDGRGRLLVNFVGPAWSFPYYHYADVLAGKIPLETFRDKVILVGSNSTGAFDHYPTPTSEFMPGLEFHANVIDNLLARRSLRQIPLTWTYVGIGVIGLCGGLLFSVVSAGVGALLAAGGTVLLLGLAQGLFSWRNLSFDVGGPLLALFLGYLAVVVYRFFVEEREKMWVKAAFGQYVSAKVLDILLADPSRLSLVGERRDMTVFFSDVAGFTSISERLNPDELVVLLNRYLSAMTEVIFQFDGYLNKYMGDGIMAFWNAPLKQADHAARACRCALRSQERLARLNEELKAQGLTPLNARIGLNTGTMIVGNMGSRQKSDYTVMGDHVNLGSRLEGANKPYGTSIMISEFTYDAIHDQFEVRYLDRLRVPGRAKPVKTYELLAEKGKLSPQWQEALPIYHEGIHLFTDRHYDSAHAKFLDVLRIVGQDKVCEMYIQRAQVYGAEPPAKDWDGVFDVKTK